ncbi:MAG: hypothetical protein KGL35_08760 [Bradyrhizobium sp.]|nr:hypothetical protein [Bradyrhizobium sp.]
MNRGPMNPDQRARFRLSTDKHVHFNWAQRHCIKCNRNRSVGQFDGDSKICRECK